MDIKKTISNPMLVGAMELLRDENTVERRNIFIDEMLKATFISPVIITPEPEIDEQGKMKLTREHQIQLPMLSTPEGKHFFMAFTDKGELEKWKKDEKQKNFTFVFDDYSNMLMKNQSNSEGVVINPFSANMVLSKEMVVAIKEAKDKKL